MKKLSKFLYVILSFVFVSTLTSGVSLSILNSQLTGGGVEESTESGDKSSDVKSDTATDIGDLYVEDYWISDTTYMSTSWSGSGTSSSPYLIQSAGDLALLSYKVFISTDNTYSGVYFKQTANIDLSEHYWMPIGGHDSEGTSTENYFSGDYDGAGFVISGVKTYFSEDGVDANGDTLYMFVGLFGSISGTSEEYVKIHGVTINDGIFYGVGCAAVVGYSTPYFKIYDCHNEAMVTGGLTCGGIAGSVGVQDVEYSSDAVYAENEIYNCINSGEITGAIGTGGIAGMVGEYVSVHDCCNNGVVTDSLTYCGGIVGGMCYYGDIYNCYNTGKISGVSCVGGIVGDDGYSINTIFNCYNVGAVTGSSHSIGGIIGYSQGHVYNCYNTANVTGSSTSVHNVGGICGYLYGSSSTSNSNVINNCYNVGYVSGGYYVGGIAGRQGYSSTYKSYFYNCYNTASVYASNTSSSYYVYVGGIVGYRYSSSTATISYCYYGGGTIKGYNTTYTRGVGNTTDTSTGTIKDSDILTDALDIGWYGVDGGLVESATWNESYPWDFDDIWELGSFYNQEYLVFVARTKYWIEESSTYSIEWLSESDGSENDPYIINSAEDLAGLSYLVYIGEYTFLDCYFKQTCNIDLSGEKYSEKGLYWMPIGGHSSDGTSTESNVFSGTYDGGGYAISGLKTYYDGSTCCRLVGLFGIVAAYDFSLEEQLGIASVHDVEIVDSYIIGRSYVGSIAGVAGYAEIYNCSSSSLVTGEAMSQSSDYYENFGGIVGAAELATIYNCKNSGYVNGQKYSRYVGGIAGVALEASIVDCSNTGVVSGYFNYIGGIVAWTYASEENSSYYLISKCHNSGRVNSYKEYDYVGGIVGYSNYMTISACYNEGTLYSLSGTTGGVVGVIKNASILDCYNAGEVSGSLEVGGIVGWMYSSYICNCYNFGSVTGLYYVGGIVGDFASSSYMYNCFNIGDVTSTSSDSSYCLYVGGVVGYRSSSYIYKCYYGNCTITGKDTDGNDVTYQKGVGYYASTSAEGVDSSGTVQYVSNISTLAKTKETYLTSTYWDSGYIWDFDAVWDFAEGENDGYPIINVRDIVYWTSDSSYYSTSWLSEYAGTESDPYLINSAEDLAGLSYLVYNGETFLNCYFELTCDIDLSGTEYSEYGLYWMPIGYYYYDEGSETEIFDLFMGNFDGGGHRISGIKTYSKQMGTGLFGAVAPIDFDSGDQLGTSSIHDVSVVDSTISGSMGVGAIVGFAIYVEIYNCDSSATVICLGNYYAGGIAGNLNGTISNCYFTGSVSGCNEIGGIAGYAYDSIASNCYNTGSVNGSYYVGGIVGCCDDLAITNCYNLGTVTGYQYVGGIVGHMNNSIVSNCYNTGSVSSEAAYVGGIAGYFSSNAIYNCFNIGDVTSTSTSSSNYYYVGGIVGYRSSTTSTISNCYYGGCTITDGNGTTYQKGIGYDISTKGEGVDAEGVTEYLAKITTLAKTKSWFTSSEIWDSSYAWDFVSVWTCNDNYNDGYPVFRALFASFAEYDSEGDFWYILDGYMPQTSYGSETPDGVDESSPVDSYTIKLSTQNWAQVVIYAGSDGNYALVTYNTSSTSVSEWFSVDPIVWIVSYGETRPTSVSTMVTAQVVTAGYISSSAGTSFSWANSSVLGMSVETLQSYMDLSLASVGEFSYDSFHGTISQTTVDQDSTIVESKVAVASASEIDALGGSYAATCTDFVAFLLSGGTTTTGGTYTSYWTRDLATELDEDSTYYSETGNTYTYSGALNNGVYVTSGGTLSNSKLKNTMGARLCMSI